MALTDRFHFLCSLDNATGALCAGGDSESVVVLAVATPSLSGFTNERAMELLGMEVTAMGGVEEAAGSVKVASVEGSG